MRIYDKIPQLTSRYIKGLAHPWPHEIDRMCHREGHCDNPQVVTTLGENTRRYLCGGDRDFGPWGTIPADTPCTNPT